MKSICLMGCSIVLAAGGTVGAATDLHGADLAAEHAAAGVVQAAPVSDREIKVSLISDIVVASAAQIESHRGIDRPQHVVAWSEEITIPDAGWVRLRFGETHLAEATERSRGSYLRITSLSDGYEQYLDADALRKWRGTSAYFNGGDVRVELMISPTADSGTNEVAVRSVMASAPTQFDRSLCGVDDRVFSTDPREARLMPIGCTAWLFGEQGNCMLTAGHCNLGNGGDVIQFNVPLSSSGGTPVNPPPQDQYPVDVSSIQDTGGATTLGNDYGFFGVFDNTDTGMSPLEAQGDSYELATSLPPLDGRSIRITGYGSTSSPVSPTLYLAQKTHNGPLFNYSGNVVQYTVDTTGGNSGGSVLDEVNQNVIAIHTNAGCESVGGNQGCSIFNAGLQNALANPIGICRPLGLNVDVQAFIPNPLDPAGGQTVGVLVTASNGRVPNGVVTMHVDTGSGFVGTAMTAVGGDLYEGAFPAADCPTTIRYYFSAEDTEGDTWSFPYAGANDAIDGLIADEQILVMSDSFETDMGWAVESTALSTGAWERAVPGDFGRNDPPSDWDGSGVCFVTGQDVNEDVDGGPTTLVSPSFDLTGIESPVIEYARWYVTDSADEKLVIEFSDDGGDSWVEAERVDSGSGWERVMIPVEDHVSVTSEFVVRFTVSDNPNDSVTESAIDAFRITSTVCNDVCAADFAEPFGVLDIFDVVEFVNLFQSSDAAADFTGDGVFDVFDAIGFVEAFNAGCP